MTHFWQIRKPIPCILQQVPHPYWLLCSRCPRYGIGSDLVLVIIHQGSHFPQFAKQNIPYEEA